MGGKRIVVAMSGASGVIYGIRILSMLAAAGETSDLIISSTARRIIPVETDYTVSQVEELAGTCHAEDDLMADIASGSTLVDGMVIAPCSMKTLSAVANSYADSLLTRAADVTLKERRRLILMVRETPFHRGHLELMLRVTDMGGIILPPIPSFYHQPQNIDELIEQTIARVGDLLGVSHQCGRRWGNS
ncbi:MAG: UbiX family flavin prenyltransferase [Deltaproteobacteria bacterium]|nr:UbiX family flavin prenyltransferase [Candidatus Anaeroferrophillus wilburensis]MBN2890002.1 UbiX family flavin prenyltransferase [Deltaproteobacteria bacterium]